jgi:hypothetical protein
VREDVDLTNLESELEAAFPAVVKGPSFSSGTQFYVTGEGEFRDFPKRGQEGTYKPVRYRDLSRALNAMVNAECEDVERYTMICWTTVKLRDIQQKLNYQIKFRKPLPALNAEGNMYEDLVGLGEWIAALNMRGIRFGFEIAHGGEATVDLIKPSETHTELCSRMKALLPALIDNAELPMRDGMTGELYLPQNGYEVLVTALNPDTGWEHSRFAGPNMTDTYEGFTPQDYSFEDETTAVRIEIFQSMLGDADHVLKVQQSYKNNAWIEQPDITFKPLKSYKIPELGPEQREKLLSKLEEFLPEFLEFATYRLLPMENDLADYGINLESDTFDITIDIDRHDIELYIKSSDNIYTHELSYETRLFHHWLEILKDSPSEEGGPGL